MTVPNKYDLQKVMQVIQPWLTFSTLIHSPANEKEYDNLVNLLDALLDLPLAWRNQQIEQLVHYLGSLIEEYDEKHYAPQLKTSGINVLKFLMQQHHLKQTDLPEIGSQSVVSEILNGKRKLNIDHVKALAKRFQVGPDTFIDD